MDEWKFKMKIYRLCVFFREFSHRTVWRNFSFVVSLDFRASTDRNRADVRNEKASAIYLLAKDWTEAKNYILFPTKMSFRESFPRRGWITNSSPLVQVKFRLGNHEPWAIPHFPCQIFHTNAKFGKHAGESTMTIFQNIKRWWNVKSINYQEIQKYLSLLVKTEHVLTQMLIKFL